MFFLIKLKNKLWLLILRLMLVAVTVVISIGSRAATPLQCADSSIRGDVVINEVLNSGGDISPFAELRVMDNNVSVNGWQFCAGKSGSCYSLTDGNWQINQSNIAVDSQSTLNTPSWLSHAINSNDLSGTEGEFVLLDGPLGSGKVIDYIVFGKKNGSASCGNTTVSGDSWSVPVACGSCLEQHQSKNKDLARSPDGSGGWEDHSKKTSTRGSDNDGALDIVDHYRFEYVGTGLTCQASDVVLKACTDASCDSLVTDSITTTLLPSQAQSLSWAGGNIISFTGQANLELASSEEQIVTLGLSAPSVQAPLRCFDNNVELASCQIAFKDTGFIFSNIPTQVSGKPSNVEYNAVPSLTIQAVKTEGNTGACIGAFPDNTMVEVELKYSCVGDDCSADVQLTNDFKTHDLNKTFAATQLKFGANSMAEFNLKYPDAGVLSLQAKKSVEFDNAVTALLEGGSNSYVVRPFGFKLDFANGSNAFAVDDLGVAAEHNGSVFKKAGENFSVTVTAVQWKADLDSAPMNGQADEVNLPLLNSHQNAGHFNGEKLKLSHRLLSPVGGAEGTLTTGSEDIVNSVVTVTRNWSEVGIIGLTASLDDGDYLEAGDVRGYIGNVGRFIPDHFSLTGEIADGDLTGQCPIFAYTGELDSAGKGVLHYDLLKPGFQFAAKNAGGSITLNYRNDFKKIMDNSIVVAAPTQDGSALGADNSSFMNLSSFVDTGILSVHMDAGAAQYGLFNYELSDNDHFTYVKDANSKVAPVTEPDIDLTVTTFSDSDGVTLALALGESLPVFEPTGPEIRFGRAFLRNAFGPEDAMLTMPLEYQYWDGAKFVINDLDNCSSYKLSDAILTPNQLGNLKQADLSVVPVLPSGGSGGLELPASNTPGMVNVELAVPAWLRFNWQGGINYDENPSAVATFGRYRGNDRIIYWREVK